MSDKQEKERKADEASKSSPLVLQLIASYVKEIEFTQVKKAFLLSGNVENFSALWCLSHVLPVAIQELGLTRGALNDVLGGYGWPKTVNIDRLLVGTRFRVPQGYHLILKRRSFFDLKYIANIPDVGSESESESEQDESLKNRKKLHVSIAADTVSEFLRACNIVYQELVKNKVSAFKIITWDMYKEVWTRDQAGKNITIYAYKQPDLNWSKILNDITIQLRAASVIPGIRAYFDMPLSYPYWSSRNESSLQDPSEYHGADQLWEDYHSLVTEKKSEKENTNKKRKFQGEKEKKEHIDVGLSEKSLEKAFLDFYRRSADWNEGQSTNTVLKIYDRILQDTYVSSTSKPSALETAIMTLSDIQEVMVRRKILSGLDDFQEASDIEKVAKAVEPQMEASYCASLLAVSASSKNEKAESSSSSSSSALSSSSS